MKFVETYVPYESSTVRAGVRVPILYMRTTKGRDADWTFDPDWDIDRRCGERRIADDSLASVIAYAVANRLPVHFTLNGGIWADASCDVPDWDINDELERDTRNCQWTARKTVPVDSALRDHSGSQASPEIGRALTFNVYAARCALTSVETCRRRRGSFMNSHRAIPICSPGLAWIPMSISSPGTRERNGSISTPTPIRQFRHWLRGTGPYAGAGGAGIPDLSAFRRAKPMTLAQVSAIAKRDFATWDAVDPLRTFPPPGDLRYQHEWNEPWRLLWDQFRRHLVQVHYTELAEWVIETGMPADKVYTAQAFTVPGRRLSSSVDPR